MLKGALLSSALLLCCALPAQAQFSQGALLNSPAAAPAGYTGQGDLRTYLAWGGVRAYSGAYASALGNSVMLCTAADALCTTIPVTSTGGLNAASLTTSGCSAISTCTAKEIFDQTGNGHNWIQTTIANRATFNPSCSIITGPCLQWTTSANYPGAGNITAAQPLTMYWVADRTANFTSQGNVLESGSGNIQNGYANSANTIIGYYGSVGSTTASDSAWHVVQAIAVNGASGSIVVDATNTGGGLGGNSFSADTLGLNGPGTGRPATMDLVELGAAAVDGTSTATATCHNAFAYWGTSTSC